MSKPNLVIVRGSSGSGKTTYASRLAETQGYKHFENDNFFVNEQGEYNFDFAFHKEAKQQCLDLVTSALNHGEDVVVSNTFNTLREMEPYLALYANIKVVEMFLDFENVHAVPDAVIQQKKKEFEPFTGATQIFNSDYRVVGQPQKTRSKIKIK